MNFSFYIDSTQISENSGQFGAQLLRTPYI